MKILFISQYSAFHSGNYIPSLLDLEEYLNKFDYKLIFAFPIEAKNQSWIKSFKQIIFLENPKLDKFRENKNLYLQLERFILKSNIKLIHTNFDGYDIVSSRISKKYKIPLIVSFHDPIVKQKNIIKNIYQNIMLQIHYRIYLRNAMIIFVNNDLSVLHKKLGIKNYVCVNNGLSFRRINKNIKINNNKNIKAFFIAGSRLEVKGVDLLADYILNNKDLNIIVNIYCDDEISRYIEKQEDNRLITHRFYDDINKVIMENDIFISLSRYETFQYAIAEAIYAGLPIIKSNCEGTNWANTINTVQVVNDSKEFKEAILNLKKITENELIYSSKVIENLYGSSIWCQKIFEVYNNVIGGLK